ncbi:MAG TPA: primosomal protein N' [Candidatus Limiplasma sp.]|nr:primosomal protein N' [Candidatus Limiplasma sp.]
MIAHVIVDVIHSNVAKPFSYLIPEGMQVVDGMRVRVPLAHRQVDGIVAEITQDCDVPPDKLKPITSVLDTYPAILPHMMALARELANEDHCPLAETLRFMLPAAMRTGRTQQKKIDYYSIAEQVDTNEAIEKQGRSQKRKMLLRVLCDGIPRTMAELAQWVSSPGDAVKKLMQDGYLQKTEQQEMRRPYEDMELTPNKAPALTREQKNALEIMLPDLKRGKGAFLLHGVTGSGKTEVYLAMVETTLQMGKNAIILVPEIALTPQMVQWFRNRFGPKTAVLHSRLTDGQRVDEWQRIRMGDANVVIGARSAIFAPLENLGLIVIDEEHEQSYLSDRHPRYDARKVAKSRCMREGATLLLSSATPSILSFAMARRGDYTLVEMRNRVLNRPMPAVTVVDMRSELAAGNRSMISGLLQQKLKECFQNGRQAMLFINRRGYHTFVSCRSCGYVMRCDQCDVSLTLHQPKSGEPGVLRCHLCGKTERPPDVCPSCGSKYIRYFGCGTQKVEEEIHKLFPNIKAIRMDNDTTQKRDAHYRMLTDFRQGKAQVLIGTQMIAKGLDYPKVTIVGVIAADLSLFIQDYRAQERTFQLITQMAGRAGRAEDHGEVIVQTYKPEHPCIIAAAAQDYRAFFEQEFARRRTGLYPPFTQFARLLVEGKSADAVRQKNEALFQSMQEYLDAHPVQKKRVLMVRADEAPIKMIRGKYRYHVLMKMFDHPDAEPLLQKLTELATESDDQCQIYYELNPTTLL